MVANPPPIFVKRYAGVRLYCAGRYLSLGELRRWRSKRVAFIVIDGETGTDVTGAVLGLA